jgi:hypothetical protein
MPSSRMLNKLRDAVPLYLSGMEVAGGGPASDGDCVLVEVVAGAGAVGEGACAGAGAAGVFDTCCVVPPPSLDPANKSAAMMNKEFSKRHLTTSVHEFLFASAC